MKGVIKNYRRGRHTQYDDQAIVRVDGLDERKDALEHLGKKVVLSLSNKEIVGKVTSAHGNNGALRVKFNKGIPGQAIGNVVEIKGSNSD